MSYFICVKDRPSLDNLSWTHNFTIHSADMISFAWYKRMKSILIPLSFLITNAQPPYNPHLMQRKYSGRYMQAEIDNTDAIVNDILRPNGNANIVDKLRSDLLHNYETESYPWNYAWYASRTNTSDIRRGLPVGVNINFHKVLDVNIKDTTMDLLVWFRLEWNDPRLEWNPDDYDGLDRAFFTLGIPDDTDLWYPDILLWNQEEQLGDSLYNTKASVTPDGTVYWSRPGHLKPSCKFFGLTKFPFDNLECTMEFGSWTHSGLYIRPYLMSGGYNLGGSETAGQTFGEVELVNVTVEEFIYPPFPVAPDEDWPVLLYHTVFTRAWQTYVRGFIILQMLLNVIGFLCFWLPPEGGERMGLAVTALLAAVAAEIVIVEQLPRASSFTWISKFSLVSLIYAVIPIIESAIVIHLHDCDAESLFAPRFWVMWRKNKATQNRHLESQEEFHDASETMNRIDGSNQKERWRRIAVMIDDTSRFLIPSIYSIFCVVVFFLK